MSRLLLLQVKALKHSLRPWKATPAGTEVKGAAAFGRSTRIRAASTLCCDERRGHHRISSDTNLCYLHLIAKEACSKKPLLDTTWGE